MSSIATKKIDQVDVNGTKQPLQIGRNGEITIGTDSSVQLNGQYISPYSGFRNRIINGDMRIDQRNAGASVTGNDGVFSADRFTVLATQASKMTIQQSTVAPSGFSNSILVTSSSAYSVLSTDQFTLQHRLEGYNTSDLAFGTSAASNVTLSFWVRSSLTGTFGGSLVNSAYTRGYVFSFIINTANTWEYKTISIAGDVAGSWIGATNGVGLRVSWSLGAGATHSNAAGSWTSTGPLGVTGQQNLVGTSGATFYLTGVQLEKGSVATPFEFRPYGTELTLCQRYYETGFVALGGYGVTTPILDSQVFNTYSFKAQKRATPTINYSGTSYTNETLTGGAVWTNSVAYPSYNTITINEITLGSKIGVQAGSAVFRVSTYFTATSEL